MIAEEHPPALVSVVTTVIAGEMALGLAFNIGVLMVSRGRLVKGAEHGNTFLASLSAVDIVACLTALPFTIVSARLSRYHNNLIFCLFSEGAVALSTTSSSLTLLCITLERYQAVTRPAHRGLLSLKPFVFLLFIWILSAFAFCAPFILHRQDALNRKEMCSLLTTTMNTSLNEALNTSSLGFQGASNSSEMEYNQTIVECLCAISEENDTDIDDEVCLVSCNMAINSSGYLRAYELVYVMSFTVTACAMGLFYLSILKVVRRRLAAKEAVASRKTTLITKASAPGRATSHPGGGEASLLPTTRAQPDPSSNRQTTISTCAWSTSTGVKGEQSSQKQQVMQPSTLMPSVYQTQSERGIQPYEIHETQMSSKQRVMDGHPHQGQSIESPTRGPQRPPEDRPQEQQPSSSYCVEGEPLRPQQIKAESVQEQVVDLGQERRIRWLSLGIVCVFLLCWGPHVLLTVLEMVQQDSLQLEAAHLVTLMLAYLTVVIHPLIYAFSRKKFRESLARLWRRFREKRRRQAHVGPAS